MKTKKTLFHIASVLGLLLVALQAQAQNCPDLQTNANVSEWSSSTVAIPDVVYPIGGSGQVNGGFAVCNGAGVQLGLRIDGRTDGPITPSGTDYTAPQGTGIGNNALWNYSGHIDFGYIYSDGGTPPNQLGEVTLTLQLDCNPFTDEVDGPTINSTGLIPETVLADTAEFIQFSDNLGFPGRCTAFGGFDAAADGDYEFTLTVTDSSGAVLAQTSATAIVGSPTANPNPGTGQSTVSVPTMSAWSAAAMAMILALLGLVWVRRQA